MSQRWKQRPPGSNWGDFGPDDQRGRLNLITREKLLQGIAEVREGMSFCLSLPLDYPGGNVLNPIRFPPELQATVRDGVPYYNYVWREHVASGLTSVSADDAVLLHLQYSTQWDSLCHIGSEFDADGDGVAEIVYYNGYRGGEHIIGPPHGHGDGEVCAGPVEARALGIENMAESCVQGRAVMIDLHRHFGREARTVGYDDLMRICESDGVKVETGDIVCLYTGFDEVILEMNRKPVAEKLQACTSLDGHDQRLLQWITDSGLSILISDNRAVEHSPHTIPEGYTGPRLPLHEHCLFKLGVHLGELWYLSELAQWLAAHDRNRFLLTAPPLRLPGAVGSPATPVATV